MMFSRFVNAFTTGVIAGSRTDPKTIARVCSDDLSASTAPFSPFIFASANACAEPAFVTFFCISSHWPPCAFIRIETDRVASAPKI
jgi:hypothetical protein